MPNYNRMTKAQLIAQIEQLQASLHESEHALMVANATIKAAREAYADLQAKAKAAVLAAGARRNAETARTRANPSAEKMAALAKARKANPGCMVQLKNDRRFLIDLQTRYNRGETLKFLYFWGHRGRQDAVTQACFSQWFPAPFAADGLTYPTAEHFMMAEKARLFGDAETLGKVLTAPNPGAAKALGRQVRGFDESRWQSHRFEIVVRANLAKFRQHSGLQDYLRNTGDRILVEASPVDRVWGIGLAKNDSGVENPNRWQGLNLLGFALMQVRQTLTEEVAA